MSSTATSRLREALGRWVRRPAFWAVVMSAAYISVSLYLSVLRVLEFATSNWDLGVFQQALWTTSHGRVFYEVGDLELEGYTSYLEVHPSLVLYLLVPLYSALPSPMTLLVVQSFAVGLAGIPIYYIARDIIGRPGPALAISGLYLSSGPLLAANLFDYHVESFLPLEFTVLFLLWYRQRYWWAIPVVLVTLVTIEVTPFLVAAMAAYFLVPSIVPPLRRLARRLWGWIGGQRDPTVGAVLTFPPSRVFQWTLALFLLSLAAYPVLRYIEWSVVPHVIASSGLPAYGPGYVPPTPTGVVWQAAWATSTYHKLGFWLTLVGLFAFLPLLAPRSLLMLAPWFVFTVGSIQISWTTLGFHYALVPLGFIPICAAFGFRKFETRIAPAARSFWARLHRAAPPPPDDPRQGRWTLPGPQGGRRLRRRATFVVLVAISAGNFVLSPLNPANQTLVSPLPGYNVRYNALPGFNDVVTLANLVPTNAVILSSSDVFPLIADNPNAYSIVWSPTVTYRLPLSAASPPDWIFLANNQLISVPRWVAQLSTSSSYELRGIAWTTPVGPVLLWERNYSGPTLVLGWTGPSSISLSNGNLLSTAVGAPFTIPGEPYGAAILSSGNLVLPFFTTRPVNLAPGHWQLSVVAHAEHRGRAGPSGNHSALEVNLTAFGEDPWTNVSFPASSLPTGTWSTVSTTLNVSEPTLAVVVAGIAPDPGLALAVDEVAFVYLGP